MKNAESYDSINFILCACKYPFHTQCNHYIVENARQNQLILLYALWSLSFG